MKTTQLETNKTNHNYRHAIILFASAEERIADLYFVEIALGVDGYEEN